MKFREGPRRKAQLDLYIFKSTRLRKVIVGLMSKMREYFLCQDVDNGSRPTCRRLDVLIGE